jgi:hypothetical protein
MQLPMPDGQAARQGNCLVVLFKAESAEKSLRYLLPG